MADVAYNGGSGDFRAVLDWPLSDLIMAHQALVDYRERTKPKEPAKGRFR